MTSTYSEMLYDLAGPMLAAINEPSPLMEMVRRDLDERKRKDDAYLATLGERERTYVLRMRRHASLTARFRSALDFSRSDNDW